MGSASPTKEKAENSPRSTPKKALTPSKYVIDTPAAEAIINESQQINEAQQRAKDKTEKILKRKATPKPMKVKRSQTSKSPTKRSKSLNKGAPKRMKTERSRSPPK